MSAIHVNRISQKILELYGSIIDMNDYNNKPPHEGEAALKSRAIAAYSIFMFTGASPQVCAETITDGYHDMGIDAVYNDTESKELYFVQSKWISDGNGSPTQGEVLKYIQGFRRVLNMDFVDANPKLLAKMNMIESALMDSDYHLHLLIAYTGAQKIADEVKADLDILIRDMNDTSDVVQYNIINQKTLYDSISGGIDSSPIVIDDIDMREWGKIQEPYLTYYGYINCEIIAHWFNEYGNRLFAKNIRFFKGSSDTNEGIVKTLTDSPIDFWYYNNGIKILCDEFSKKPIYADDRTVGLFTAKGVSVVNGAQTVGCIGTAYHSNPEKVKEAKVFVQFISLEQAPEGYDVQVTRLSNTQNKIDGRDFAALDPEQDRIKRDMWMDGFTYNYKSNNKIKSSSNDIYLDEVTIALACYAEDIKLSTLSKRNLGAFYEDITKQPYTLIYNNEMSSVKALNLVKELRYIDEKLSTLTKSASGKQKQMLVHGNRFIAHVIMQIQPSRYKFHNLLNMEVIISEVDTLLNNIISGIESGIAKKYADNYLNSLFKNNQKCLTLFQYVKNYLEQTNKQTVMPLIYNEASASQFI